MTSLTHLLPPSSPRHQTLTIERTAAVILTKFEQLWHQFVEAKGSFEPFLELYLNRWLHRYALPSPPSPTHVIARSPLAQLIYCIHSDQLVTLTTTTPPTPVRITGITLDHGLLRTIPERSPFSSNPYFSSSRGGGEEYIDLQPDGNSFDLMAGMIRAKK
ncbi:hypothetical protein NP233_g4427 [Leucocoprinus birnbaumii]|uniref:Uncharacterized protein n=1 Tax=Leucocoprinus birnbaumii TaxID=56174 RepID=A0AAD5VVA9_9AGAR|nr:hypothetical protein NP233_g4427 [Leucocoprinus birnbaumii]